MKKTTTIAFSVPAGLALQIDVISKEMHISRSALLTMIIAAYLKKKGE